MAQASLTNQWVRGYRGSSGPAYNEPLVRREVASRAGVGGDSSVRPQERGIWRALRAGARRPEGETVLASLALAIVGAIAFGPYVLRGGFTYDGWQAAAIGRLQGFGTLFNQFISSRRGDRWVPSTARSSIPAPPGALRCGPSGVTIAGVTPHQRADYRRTYLIDAAQGPAVRIDSLRQCNDLARVA